jgi:beta-glucanase (GH16 family)
VHPVASQSDFHKYGLEWTETKLEWLIDDVVVRTLTPADVDGDFYPQTPMQLRIGSWAAGDPDNEEGTIGKFHPWLP